MNCWKKLFVVILKRVSKITAIIFFLTFICRFSIVCAEELENRKVVVVLVNFTNFEEFLEMESLSYIIDKGAIGLMNTRGSGKTDSIRAHATLGWGSRSDATSSHSVVQMNNDGLYVKEIQNIHKYNLNNSYGTQVGWLGDFLNSKDLTTALIGNQDIENELSCPAALMIMDSMGKIDVGSIGQEVLTYSESDLTIRTNFQSLYDAFHKFYDQSDVIVIDTGDTSRYEYYQNRNNNLDSEKKLILKDIDQFIGEIARSIDLDDTLLMILSPHYSREDAKAGKKLTPVVFYGATTPKGLLISDTTRWDGIIGNIDIAPSIAMFFSGFYENVTGESVTVKPMSNYIEQLMKIYQQTNFNSKNRTRILKIYIGFQIILLMTILLVILLKLDSYIKINTLLRALILFVLTCPFALFIIPLLKINSFWIYVFVLVILNTLLAYILYKSSFSQERHIIYIGLITSLAIIVDLIFGGYLCKTSILGYDPVIGARYYGLGNEYMGILISSVLIWLVPLAYKQVLSRLVAVVILALIVPVIGLSIFGANVGGTITAVVSFGFVIFNILKRKLTVRNTIGILILVVIIVGLFAGYDLFFSEQQSHLAKAIQGFSAGGIGEVINIIRRKIEMNLKLLRWTIWSQVLLVSVLVMVILAWRPKGRLYELINKYKSFSVAWYAIIIASITGMLVNDSGVVVAATTNIFLVFSILYFLLGDKNSGVCNIR